MTRLATPGARRALGVGVVAVLLVAALYFALKLTPEKWVDNSGRKASRRTWRLSAALAMVAVTFLAATLSIGPIRVLRGHRPAVHLPWRRTLGVTGSLLAVSHLLVAMNVHGRLWRPWDQFFTGRPSLDDPLIVLHDTRGVANYLGLTAASALVALALLSRNSWIRRLGAVRWKMAQRTLYVVFAVVALHAVLYWRVERRLAIHQFLVLTPIVAATGLQVAAAIASTVRARRRAPVPADARPNGAKG